MQFGCEICCSLSYITWRVKAVTGWMIYQKKHCLGGCGCCCLHHKHAVHMFVLAASYEGGRGEQGGNHQTRGTWPGRALPQSAVLQRCSLLQQGEFTHLETNPRLRARIGHSNWYETSVWQILFIIIFWIEMGLVSRWKNNRTVL